jgi:HlyD family secretion protein
MQDAMKSHSNVVSKRWILVAGVALLGIGGAIAYNRSQVSRQQDPTPIAAPAIQTVTALGRLAPVGEVIKLSAPSSNQGNRVERLLVNEGDRVTEGQVIAILDTYSQRQAAWQEAEEAVVSARAKLAQIQAGAKSGEIAAQSAKSQQAQVELQNDREAQIDEIARVQAQWDGDRITQMATIRRLQATLDNAKSEFDRYRQLHAEGAIALSLLDSKQLAVNTAQEQVAEAQATLDRINRTSKQQLQQAQTRLQRINASGQQQVASAQATLAQVREVRSVDMRAAQAEVDRAIAAADQAKASLANASVRAPQAGEVLYIYTRSGEVVSSNGIVELGQTQTMQAIAEVYQSDVGLVKPGQRVRVTGDAFSGELTGTVDRVGSQVRRQTIVNTDPSANIDARVIEVHAILDAASSLKAAKFTNLQVQVEIEK